jgi:hypothetical protein
MRDSPVEHSTLHILVDRHDVVGPKPGWDPALGSVGKNGRGKGYILLSPISYLGLTWTRPVLRKSHGATHLRRSMPTEHCCWDRVFGRSLRQLDRQLNFVKARCIQAIISGDLFW